MAKQDNSLYCNNKTIVSQTQQFRVLVKLWHLIVYSESQTSYVQLQIHIYQSIASDFFQITITVFIVNNN